MSELPPCGCRTGCMHRDQPQFPAQRTCRAGVMPRPLTEVDAQTIDTVIERLGISLATWQRALLAAAMGVSSAGGATPEQSARVRWGTWRALRTTSTRDPE